jgi:hypothetical protein
MAPLSGAKFEFIGIDVGVGKPPLPEVRRRALTLTRERGTKEDADSFGRCWYSVVSPEGCANSSSGFFYAAASFTSLSCKSRIAIA